MLSQPVFVAIVDDHNLFRKTLKNYLSEQKDIHIVIQATDMFDLLDKLKHVSVDVLIMDLFMPGLNGSEAVNSMRTDFPNIKILILSMCHDLEMISDLLDSGIHGYISKSDEPEELVQAIHAVAENRIYHNRLFTEALYRSMKNNIKAQPSDSLPLLNDREKRILQSIWEEKSNKEIADLLFLSTRSVEKIRQDMKEKLGIKSTVGLLKYAIAKKIIGAKLNPTFLVSLRG